MSGLVAVRHRLLYTLPAATNHGGMDFSIAKVTAETGPDDESRRADVASSSPLVNLSTKHHHHQPSSQPSTQHPCPACPSILGSARELTTHLRGHNSATSSSGSNAATTDEDESYSCGVCHKVLSSASSLDRHVLVHSGERPFKCKYCDMAFTTNGNMNRHLRTAHGNLSCTDSEGASSDSEHHHRPAIKAEYNNNEVAKRQSPELKRKHPEEGHDGLRRHKVLLNNSRAEIETTTSLCCNVCGKRDFATDAQLEAHLERNHPKTQRNSVVGFNDLTFIDFSSGKFPAIARAVCEQSLHRPASGEATRYQCSKCLRGFPCRSALDAHEIDCGQMPLMERKDPSSRDDFFAGLDLQNKAAMVEAKEGKDLADIQSIISVTSGPILNFSRSDASTPDNCKIKQQNFGSSGSSGTPSSEYAHEEEAQDAFAAEFRKMKLKGEFPCRLCSAVFPNLRALKGHNRQHMDVRPGMPYPCNMCPYSSMDKATLQRHLRSHNGDRPYECSLCNYAFTTKANCERHVRNRHGKLSREEIKSVLIYHPSEDSTNDGSLERTSEARKSLVYHDELPTTPTTHYPGEIRIKDEAKLRAQNNIPALHPIGESMFSRPIQPLELTYGSRADDTPKPMDEDGDSRSSDGSVKLVDEPEPIKEEPKKVIEVAGTNGEDAPLDLSMDVLDLSKKAAAAAAAAAAAKTEQPKDFYSATNQLLLTQALLKANAQPPRSSLESYYASQAHMLYSNFGMPLQPYLFGPHLFSQDFIKQDRLQKELVRGLQTSGGSLVEPGYPTYPQPPTVRNPEQNDFASLSKLPSKPPSEKASSGSSQNSSVKMVIKNGVLIPKQKQRRYRTERPFTCEFCTARFTLRSNMERHVKQQHPQHWSQRPRGGHSTRGRPPANPPTLLHHLNQQQSYASLLQPTTPSLTQQDYASKHAISDQVKYAILAQQLKGNKPEENESDEDLVIDEEKQHAEAKEPSERTLSLLRGKLEANIESKVNEEVKDQEIKKELECCLVDEEPVKMEICPDLKDEALMGEDLASVSEIVDNASQNYQQFHSRYMSDEEGLVASTSDCNQSGSDEKSDSVNSGNSGHSSTSKKKKKMKKKKKKKSAYSMAPNRVICPYCERPFPWTSSLRRHILTHTGQKPYQCMHCSLLFTTKSNCDRHLLRKHKNSINKIRRTRSTSSPEVQEPIPPPPPPAIVVPMVQEELVQPEEQVQNVNNQFTIRNVPERPYKCNQCPSSTFSTKSNLKKHRSTKHGHYIAKSRPESPSSEPQLSPQECQQPQQQQQQQQECHQQEETKSNHADQSGYESQSSGVSEPTPMDISKTSSNDAACRSRRNSPVSSPVHNPVNNNNNINNNSESPFKCHLCDSGFAERQDCLDHIKDNHEQSYEMLVAKGALDMDIDSLEEQMPPAPPPQPSDGEERRGRFPDYSNRKVVCAFCMRRFWSAEDLRRHMRTHTGERPFSCDVCRRRFTLKHSMLRHRKKHGCADSSMYVGTSGDEDNNTPPTLQQPAPTAPMQDRASLPQVASVATGDAAPSLAMRFNLGKLSAGMSPIHHVDANDNTDNTDLISNLLGIRDKSIIDRALQSSIDDAAKLIGIKGNHD